MLVIINWFVLFKPRDFLRMKELEHSKTLDHLQTNRIDNQGIAVISDVLASKVIQ